MHKLRFENELKQLLYNINLFNNNYFYKNNKYHFPNINFFFNNINNLKFFFFFKFIIFLFLLFNFIFTYSIYNLNYNSQVDDGDIFIKGRAKSYLKRSIINIFNTYIKICNDSKLLDRAGYPLSKKPKISVIMPIYNGGKYLYYSLRSIQNQKMKEIEIILIDDYSSDNSIN